MRDYSVYHIMPPSLFVIPDGPEIYISGFSESQREKIFELFENLIYDYEIGFYYNDDPITDENIGWIEYVIYKANFVLVNANNITLTEQYIIDNVTSYDEKGIMNKLVIYYSDDGLTPHCRILAKNEENVMFDLNDLEHIIKSTLTNEEEIYDEE